MRVVPRRPSASIQAHTQARRSTFHSTDDAAFIQVSIAKLAGAGDQPAN